MAHTIETGPSEFDDGLVHSHGWARSAPASAGPDAAHYLRAISANAIEVEPIHDDGLVHGHAWARE